MPATSTVALRASAIHGIGVFAQVEFGRGHPILKIDDSRLVTDARPLRPGADEHAYHCDYLSGGRVILMQVPERHINHSCRPNAFVRTVLGARYVFALTDIAVGEEITYDYCVNGAGDTVWRCTCGSARCRKDIHSDFFHLPLALQLEYLPLLDDWYISEHSAQVSQLLRAAGAP